MMNIKLFLMVLLVLVGCHKSNGSSVNGNVPSEGAGSIVEQMSECSIDRKIFEFLSEDSCAEILNRLDMQTVVRAFHPNDWVVQTAVGRQVQGHWPQWFLDKIARESGAKGGRNLVLYYLAFMNLPSALTQKDNHKHVRRHFIYADSKIDPTRDHVFGVVGDHAIAYLDMSTRSVFVYDTILKKVVFTGKNVPAAVFPVRMSQMVFEPLGPRTFLLVTLNPGQARAGRPHTLSLWNWSKEQSEGPDLIKTDIDFDNRYFVFEVPPVLRVADDQFVALRHDPTRHRVMEFDGPVAFDVWKVAEQELQLEKTVIHPSLNLNSSLARQLKQRGISVDSMSLFSNSSEGESLPLTKNTRLKLKPTGSIWYSSSNGSHDIQLINLKTVERDPKAVKLELRMTPHGDIIFNHGFGYINFWEILDSYAKDLIAKFERVSQTSGVPCKS